MCVVMPRDGEVYVPATRWTHVEHIGPISTFIGPLLNHTHSTKMVQSYHSIIAVLAEDTSMQYFEGVRKVLLSTGGAGHEKVKAVVQRSTVLYVQLKRNLELATRLTFEPKYRTDEFHVFWKLV